MNWGTVGYFGPLTIHPDFWDQGIAQKLMGPIMETFDEWKTEHVGLFTFLHSPKHLELYRKFGFWPPFLTAFMSKPVARGADAEMSSSYARLPETEKEACLVACRELTDQVYSGLDLTTEIQALHDHGLVTRYCCGAMQVWTGSLFTTVGWAVKRVRQAAS